MQNVLLVVHLLLALAMIGTIMLQRNEGGALGIGGGNSMNNFMTGRGAANLLSRTTAVLAGLFMLTSIALTMLEGGRNGTGSITDQIAPTTTEQPAPAPQPALD